MPILSLAHKTKSWPPSFLAPNVHYLLAMSLHNSPSKSPPVTPSPRGPSTFDLLRWSDAPFDNTPRTPVRISATNDSSAFMNAANPSAADTPASRPAIRTNQPAGGISTTNFGAKLTLDEAEALQKKRPNSDFKKREMSGSGIFTNDPSSDSPVGFSPDKPMVRVYQPAGGVSQISFGLDGTVSPKKPTSLTEVAKQRELSGTLETACETSVSRLRSTAKVKELVGSNIFGPPPEVPPKCLGRHAEEEQQESRGPIENNPRGGRNSVKVSNPAGGRSQVSFGLEEAELSARKIHNQKVADLSGNDIFKDETTATPPEKMLSVAKLREMSGNDIFADEKPVVRDLVGGIRKPPGGESSLTLV